MDWEHTILSRIAEKKARQLTRKVISNLQELDSTLSGDDSGLINVWDEICVQVQDEQSWWWDLYLDLAKKSLYYYVEQLNETDLLTIWFQSQCYIDWLGVEHSLLESPVACVHDVVELILQEYLLAEADTWSNSRIRNYIDCRNRPDPVE